MFAWRLRERDFVKSVFMRTFDGALSPESFMHAENARHPLLETVVLFTGPNACGKTVYMTQLGDFDRIFTRISSFDSVATGLSTFASVLKQIGEILNNYTARSLMLVDEFGKGTLDCDGKALFEAFWQLLVIQHHF
jgi:DNA mismatch repair ATPase MutS